jgi:hypothetical protein
MVFLKTEKKIFFKTTTLTPLVKMPYFGNNQTAVSDQKIT